MKPEPQEAPFLAYRFHQLWGLRYEDPGMGDIGGPGLEGMFPAELENISPEPITPKPRGYRCRGGKSFP